MHASVLFNQGSIGFAAIYVRICMMQTDITQAVHYVDIFIIFKKTYFFHPADLRRIT